MFRPPGIIKIKEHIPLTNLEEKNLEKEKSITNAVVHNRPPLPCMFMQSDMPTLGNVGNAAERERELKEKTER